MDPHVPGAFRMGFALYTIDNHSQQGHNEGMIATSPVARPTSTSLDRLAPGQHGRVTGISGLPSTRRRLLEMGLGHGVEVEVLRRAPLGDPIELGVRGYLLSLRLEQAALIAIDPL